MCKKLFGVDPASVQLYFKAPPTELRLGLRHRLRLTPALRFRLRFRLR